MNNPAFAVIVLLMLTPTAWAEPPSGQAGKKEKTLGDLLGQPDGPPAIDTPEPKPDGHGKGIGGDRPLATTATESAATIADLPTQEAIDEAASVVRDLYKDDIAAAKSPAQKTELARVLLKQAKDSKSDPAGYFVLLEEACSLAIKGGDVVTAFEALDRLTSTFRVSDLKRMRDALEGLAGTSPPAAHKQIAELALALIDQAVGADDYVIAKDLVGIGATSARKSKDADAAKIAVAKAAEIDKLAKQFAVVKDSIATLEQSPDDPKANLAAGTYFCFAKGNWARGLPMLARSDDMAFKVLAEKDLARPRESAAQMTIGDGWWNVSESQEGVAKRHLRVRATDWYRQAIPKASGLAKAKAEKRLADVSAELVKGATGGATLPLFAKAQNAVKNNKLKNLGPVGFGIGKQWSDVPEQGGVLVGLDVGLHPRDGYVVAVRGVYATQRGEIRGELIGLPTPLVVPIKAKPGYAVGAMSIRGGLNVDGLVVTFMQIQGDRLNPAQKYMGENIGGRGGNQDELSDSGEPIIGLQGHLHRDGRIASLGIITPMTTNEGK